MPGRGTFFALDKQRLPEFVERLPELGVVYVQARTDCGGAGKLCELTPVYIDYESHTLCSPAVGLMVSLDECKGVNATSNGESGSAMCGFDFEFESRPCGLSIYALPLVSDMDCYTSLIDQFFGKPLDREDLDEWREGYSPANYHCDNCERAGLYRAKYPERHPVCEIFQGLIGNQTRVFSRVMSSYSDLSISLEPENIVIDSGIVSVIGNDSSVLALHMHNLHALVIKRKTVDGSDVSAIGIYNSLGTKGLEFLVEDPALVEEWSHICELAKTRDLL